MDDRRSGQDRRSNWTAALANLDRHRILLEKLDEILKDLQETATVEMMELNAFDVWVAC